MKELQKGTCSDFKYQQDIFGSDIASYGSREIFFIILQLCFLKLCLFGHVSFRRSSRTKPFHLIVVKCCPKVEQKIILFVLVHIEKHINIIIF